LIYHRDMDESQTIKQTKLSQLDDYYTFYFDQHEIPITKKIEIYMFDTKTNKLYNTLKKSIS